MALLGTGHGTKMDEFSEKFQTAFDTPPPPPSPHFWKDIVLFFSKKIVRFGTLTCPLLAKGVPLREDGQPMYLGHKTSVLYYNSSHWVKKSWQTPQKTIQTNHTWYIRCGKTGKTGKSVAKSISPQTSLFLGLNMICNSLSHHCAYSEPLCLITVQILSLFVWTLC